MIPYGMDFKEETKLLLNEHKDLISKKDYDLLFSILNGKFHRITIVPYTVSLLKNANIDFLSYMKSIHSYMFFRSDIKDIQIPSCIQSIEYEAFRYCKDLVAVDIPDSVLAMQAGVFSDCVHLTSIKLPSYIKKIPPSFCSGCSSLTSIIIPEGVSVIDDSAFYNCQNLLSVALPSSLTSIEDLAFNLCPSLKELRVPKDCDVRGAIDRNITIVRY